MRVLLFLLLVLLLSMISSKSEAASKLVVAPGPLGEPFSSDYQVFANGKPVFCYTSFRFDPESKATLSGRPVSPLSFCTFDHDGPVEIEVRFLDGLKKAGIDTSRVVVRPLSLGIKPVVRDGRIRFKITQHGSVTVEPGGSLKHSLHIFSNPLEKDVPDPKDPNVLYFGPGLHMIDGINIKSGQTVYVAAGAVVYLKPLPKEKLGPKHNVNDDIEAYGIPGLFVGDWGKNITLRGRGILCGRKALKEMQRGSLAKFEGVTNLTVEGVIIRECSVWSLNVVNCNNVHVSNVKVIGHYVNNDGIVIGGTSDAVVEGCFSHNADDSLEVKVWKPQKNVTFRNCVVWNDIGGSFGLMHETGAELENVLYENCTVLHSTDNISACPVVGLKLTGPGNVSNVRFENITIEDVVGNRRPALKVINNWDDWHLDYPTKPDNPYVLLNHPERKQPSGSIRNVLFKNINVLNCKNTDVALISDGPESPVEGIMFENVIIGGKKLVQNDPRIKKNVWVRDIVVHPTAK